VLLLNGCLLLLLFISLSTQSGNFWIHAENKVVRRQTSSSKSLVCSQRHLRAVEQKLNIFHLNKTQEHKGKDATFTKYEQVSILDRGSRFRFSTGAGYFSLHRRVQTGSGAHPASYPRGNRSFFPGCRAALE
jgi:hypothetical protein